MKRYVARRSRIIRNNIDVDGGMIKCEVYDQIVPQIVFLMSMVYIVKEKIHVKRVRGKDILLTMQFRMFS